MLHKIIMKKLVILIFLLITGKVLSQTPNFSTIVDESTLKGKGIIEYNITEINHLDPKSYTNSLLCEKAKFDKNGKKLFYLKYNFDVVNTTDSVYFNYNKLGDLIEIIEIRNDAPIGKEQLDFISQFGGMGRIIKKKIITYNDQRQIVESKSYVNENIDIIDIDKYSYNDLNLVWKHERIASQMPEQDNFVEYYKYDKRNKLIQTDIIYSENPKDTLRSIKLYDSNSKIVSEHIRRRNVDQEVSYKYEDSMLASKDFKIGNIKHSIVFLYNDKDQLIEKKRIYQGKLEDINRYKYNNEGLLVEIEWIDVNSGETESSSIIKYMK